MISTHSPNLKPAPAGLSTCAVCGRVFVLKQPRRANPDERRCCSRSCTGKLGGANGKAKFISPDATKAEKIRANGLINERIKRGALLRPDRCSECGKAGRVDAHHEDYSKPDEVEWLCRSCHMKRHFRTGERGVA